MEKPKLLDRMRNAIRVKHYSLRTEETYIMWVKRYIFFHNKRHPKDMKNSELSEFLTHLAVRGKVSASTQNQALNAILFLYKHVLKQDIGWIENVERAKRPEKIPVVFTSEEALLVLKQLKGTLAIMANLLYGSGLRLMECLRLRVKDIDFNYNHIVVRDGKGQKDRTTMLPIILKEPLQAHLKKVKELHQKDLNEGFGRVYLPFALEKKYPNANKEEMWQYVFPSKKRSIDPRSGEERRHHAAESVLQKAVKEAVRSAGINKPGSCHTFRHSFAPLEM